MASDHLIVGTAGHIDHGKTSLIRALTGVDLDRLPEEKARGITIALGFTHLTLPSGRVAAFVDVPGHERLVRTMIAGATGLDAVILAVSAVEGVMPQTREHLAILNLLGVRRGVVALTMADLVDEELLELARMDVAEALEGTLLEGAPIVATSAGPQPRGLDELVKILDEFPVEARGEAGPFRLPIDRAFVLKGFGTVVTGTVRSGTLRDGEDVRIEPGGLVARVRGIQVHGESVPRTRPGLRTAINLAGVDRDALERGMVVVRPGEIHPTSVIEGRYEHLSSSPPLEDGTSVRLLIGTAEVLAVLSTLEEPLIEPGASALIQLRTEEPIVTLPQDRFVLRRPSPSETLGGGLVLDPWARRVRRRDYDREVNELNALESGDISVLLQRAGDAGLPPDEARRRGVSGRLLGDRVIAPERAAALERALLDELGAWHRAHPLAQGAPRRDLRRGPLGHLSERAFDALIADLSADPGPEGAPSRIVAEGPRVRLPEHAVRPTPAQQAAIDALDQRVRAAGVEGLPFDELVTTSPDLLQLLLDRGVVERVAERVHHGVELASLVERVRTHLREHDTLGPADFKALTGLTRRTAIPLLEWLDARKVTVRAGDLRRLKVP